MYICRYTNREAPVSISLWLYLTMSPRNTAKHLRSDSEIQQRIVEFANQSFRSHGIKEVTMDHIARSLHMSKRTIYQFFADKEDLIIACLRQNEEQEQAFVQKLHSKHDNILDIMFLHMEYSLGEIGLCNPQYFSDSYLYPRVRACIEQRSAQRVEEILEVLRTGVEQGMFLPHVDFRLIVLAMINQITQVLQDKTFVNYTLEHCILNIVLIVVRGCATLQGIARIDEFCLRYIEKRQLSL